MTHGRIWPLVHTEAWALNLRSTFLAIQSFRMPTYHTTPSAIGGSVPEIAYDLSWWIFGLVILCPLKMVVS